MIALPPLTAWVVYQAPGAADSLADQAVDIPHAAGPAAFSAADSLRAWIAALEGWALPVWFTGVLVFALRPIWSSRHVARLRREGSPAEASLVETVSRLARRMQIGRPVRVLISRLIDTPSVAGWLRPVVLLPAASLLSLSVKQLEAVLAHELAHIRRHDYLVNVLQTLVETLLFYQPRSGGFRRASATSVSCAAMTWSSKSAAMPPAMRERSRNLNACERLRPDLR